MPKRVKPNVISFEDLEKLNTKQLLGYLRKLHKCEESFELSDLDKNPDIENESIIHFKNTDKWKFTHQNVKTILKKREHVN
ncbi:MAG TPA: hypothetical protein VKY36_01375 [Moheibacter sp.]|nr:hypothetical protein [Moheibacter sp.]